MSSCIVSLFGFHRRAHLGGSPTGGKAVSDRTASFIASAPSLGSCLQSEGLWGVRTLPAAGLGGGALQMCGVWQNLLELKPHPTLVRSPTHAEDV